MPFCFFSSWQSAVTIPFNDTLPYLDNVPAVDCRLPTADCELFYILQPELIIMRWIKWIGIVAAALLIAACFMDWVVIVSKNITVSGVDSTGTNFGKPGYLHFVLTFFFVVFSLLPILWIKRANLLVTALNLAWAVRNYFFISTCSGGECPDKHTGLYLVLLSSLVMLIAAMFPDIKLKESSKD